MTGEQRKYLKDRLSKVAGQKRGAIARRDPKEPVAVTRARKVVRDYETRETAQYRKRMDKLDARADDLRQLVLFAKDHAEPMAALDKFEREKF